MLEMSCWSTMTVRGPIRMENLVKGNDGLVRSVSTRTKNGATNRPVSKLYPLKLSDVSTATQGVGGREDCTTDISLTSDRPHRNAAQCARQAD